MGFVLGISGPALAGKDTLGDYLVKEHGWSGKLSFARNLKDMCKEVFGLTEYDVNHQDGKKKLFAQPLVLNDSHLCDILIWMATHHPDISQVQEEGLAKVSTLVGTEMDNPRHVLQIVGTEICRTLIPTYHVDVVKQATRQPGNWIVTDVRFPNEGDLILDELQGIVIRLNRAEARSANINRRHPSETAMLDWGRFSDVIENSADGLSFFFQEIDNFLERNDIGTTQRLSDREKTQT